MKIGDTAQVSIGPASDFLGQYKTIKIVEIFTNTVVIEYEDQGEMLRIISKDNWNELTKEKKQ